MLNMDSHPGGRTSCTLTDISLLVGEQLVCRAPLFWVQDGIAPHPGPPAQWYLVLH